MLTTVGVISSHTCCIAVSAINGTHFVALKKSKKVVLVL